MKNDKVGDLEEIVDVLIKYWAIQFYRMMLRILPRILNNEILSDQWTPAHIIS